MSARTMKIDTPNIGAASWTDTRRLGDGRRAPPSSGGLSPIRSTLTRQGGIRTFLHYVYPQVARGPQMPIGMRGRRRDGGADDWRPAFTLRWPRRVYRVLAEPTGR